MTRSSLQAFTANWTLPPVFALDQLGGYRSIWTFWPESHSALNNRQGELSATGRPAEASLVNDTQLPGFWGGGSDHGETMRFQGQWKEKSQTHHLMGRLFSGSAPENGKVGSTDPTSDGWTVHKPSHMLFPELFRTQCSAGISFDTGDPVLGQMKLSLGIDSPGAGHGTQNLLHKKYTRNKDGTGGTPYFPKAPGEENKVFMEGEMRH